MAKHIGIVACSAEGAALCYRMICSEAPAMMGEQIHLPGRAVLPIETTDIPGGAD